MIIIAILTAVAVPTFLAQKSTANKTQVLGNVSNIQKAILACGANNNDGALTGCAEHTHIWDYEPSVRHLLRKGSGGWFAPDGRSYYDVDGIDETGAIIYSPGRTQPLYGFQVTTAIRDGDKEIVFRLKHDVDGKVVKECYWNGHAKGPVAGSRICTNGTW